jgi:predicted nicotinamide N-methyase
MHTGSRSSAPAPAPVARAWPQDYPVKSIDLDGSGRTIDIHEAARSNAGGVGGELWDGAIVLARWLQLQLAARGTGCAVLELGAGTGLVGISAAGLGGARVVLTDRGEVFEVTQLNAAKNQPVVQAGQGLVQCEELDWLLVAGEVDTLDSLLDEDHLSAHQSSVVLPMPPVRAEQQALTSGSASSKRVAPGWDFVVGSDILYDARMYKVLARLINAAIRTGSAAELAEVEGVAASGSRTVCALSYSVSPHTITQFFRLCEGYGLTVTQLSRGELMAALEEPTFGAEWAPESTNNGVSDGSDVEEEERTSHLGKLYSHHCDGEVEDVSLVLVSLVAQ